jgi:hypothetical protein
MLSPRGKAVLALCAGVLILGAMLALAGPAKLAEALHRASLPLLLLAALTYALFFVLRGIRWRMLLSRSAPHVRTSSTTSITAVGWLANSILPFKGGDVLRAALLAKRERVPAGTSAATVTLERILDLLGVALLAGLGLALLPASTTLAPGLRRALLLASLLPLALIVALVPLVVFRTRATRISEATLGRLGKLGARLHAFFASTLEGLHALARRPRLLAALVPMTVAVSLAQTLLFVILVEAYLPATPPLVAFGGGALFLVSFVVSVTPGNVGTYEAAFAAIFAALGTPLPDALSAAVLTHVTTTLLVAALGGLGMLALGLRPSRVAATPPVATGGGRA